MAATNRAVAETAERELVITRVFDAPRALVFKLWTDPAHALKWMGPRSHPVTRFETDPRPGGAWRACLTPQDGGAELWQGGVNREMVEPERLQFTFAWDAEKGQPRRETLVTVTFEEHEGKTRMTFRQTPFDTEENRDGHREGWNSSFDRLEDYVRDVAGDEALSGPRP